MVKLLLAAAADPDCICIVSDCTYMINVNAEVLHYAYMHLQSSNQCTPLYVASARGFNDVVKSLIAANADVNCTYKVSHVSCIPLMCLVYKR